MSVSAFDQLSAEFEAAHAQRLTASCVTRRKRQDVLATLDTMTTFTLERQSAERKKLNSPQAIMNAFPDVRLVIDAKEPRVRRPTNTKDADGYPHDNQKPYYLRNKKAHTVKNQLAVRPDGLVEAPSGGVSGSATHDLTLLRQTNLLHELAPDEAAMLDKIYDGIRKDYPEVRRHRPYKDRRHHLLADEEEAFNRLLARYRIVVEHIDL
jgi:hypothetical protein